MTSRGLALFSETIVVSLAVGVLSLPGVTALPAVAAGAAHVHRHVRGESDTLLELGRDFLRALRGGWVWGLLAAVVYAGISITVSSPMTSAIPGGEVFRWGSLALGALIALVLLRAAARWRFGVTWAGLIRLAGEQTVRDPAGSSLLLLALGLAYVIVWMFAPLVVLVPGLLIFAACAVATRAE
ncbi:hypothetical protein RZO50_04895 [Microbacterium sp. SSW1-59]|uniref:hypothetical protein n=1 Tax=Microbacterium xanthum TaxID=3079794 RepID=UPI002AD4117F|nr:hypothetical protein [Microbacterium sp. SSW1-59]MDZ8200836.1 hypothetical protein [Microbacterium sp. SSW1-59]